MSISLFPIGTVASKVSYGVLDSIQYNMFEPNAQCHSNAIHTTLTTLFQDQTMLTRKKAAPYLTISYEYENILNREYNQIEHFVYKMDDALTPFYAVDWSKGQEPTVSASLANKWRISVDNTRMYSSISNEKSNKMFLWNGTKWKLGDILHVTTNATVALDLTYYHRGSLRYSEIGDALAYPVYEVRFSQNALSGFKPTVHVESSMALSSDGGYMRSGIISFISKYKV